MPDERGAREGLPPLWPMPHPKEDECGHGHLIAACPYERCVARKLYVALTAIQWGQSEMDYTGTVYHLCPECDRSEVRGHDADCSVGVALAGTTLPSRPAGTGGETENETPRGRGEGEKDAE